MKYCPITYEPIPEFDAYSLRGLRLLSPQLKQLDSLELSAEEQRREAVALAGKMSIQGVQTKLSAQLKVSEGRFNIVAQKGEYILKPQSDLYPQLPQNEAITMTLAKTIGLDIPIHGLVYSKDNSMTYFIKRFDRVGHHKKLAMEDFAQLSGADRHTKYDSSMEKVIQVIAAFCTFPKLEFVKLFKLTLFNFLVGNEDMHLKNFSLLTTGQKISLSPAYDLLNSTIAMGGAKEEIALTLNGKKSNLKRRDFIEYFAVQRLGLNTVIIDEILNEISNAMAEWENLIKISFLSSMMQEKYVALLKGRAERLDLKRV